MKNYHKILFIILLPLMMFFGCKERTELTGPQAVSGKADFSRFVTIGNSLTAGYQSSALYESSQMYSIGNMIAQQTGTDFVQPVISDPGLGGQLKIVSLDPFVTTQVQDQGTLTNLAYDKAYNNLGIPGIVLADITQSSTQNSYSHSPFIDLVLRGRGTQLEQALSLQPTMISFWLGNNDVLGFATSGGFSPAAPTDANTFGFLYRQVTDALAASGAKVVVANIPDVTAIPFFTTVGPMFVQSLQGTPVQGFYYQKHGQYTGSAASISQLTDYSILFTLISQSYLAYFGRPSGKFYRDHGVDITPLITFGILDTTQAFGASEKNPIPDALVLDTDEIQTAKQATASFNTSIAAAVSRHSSQFALADINHLLNMVRASDASGGTELYGVNFSTMFVTGGLFSLDGVHPTSRGYAVIANEFLKAVNNKFNSNYPMIDVTTIPGSLSFAKAGYFNLFQKGTYLDPAAYENILF